MSKTNKIALYHKTPEDIYYIVSQEWWNKNHRLDDSISPENKLLFETLKKLCFAQESESMYYINCNEQFFCYLMEHNGFTMTKDEDFSNFISK